MLSPIVKSSKIWKKLKILSINVTDLENFGNFTNKRGCNCNVWFTPQIITVSSCVYLFVLFPGLVPRSL